ncbi:MAG TPA: hypothetical protein VKR21_14965 [Solirubrobacteraceae bacterium]|nr:hypothetical protein [Solirubrobacteraceae bacterium]
MTREERIARRRLEALAADEQGRQLLQLALRGIQTSGHGVTIGCWVKPGGGVAGCVFQHAYWQGVSEGVFETAERADREVRAHVDDHEFHLVMEAIRALDSLGKRRFLRRRGLRRELDELAWRATVERLLIDALSQRAKTPEPERLPASA